MPKQRYNVDGTLSLHGSISSLAVMHPTIVICTRLHLGRLHWNGPVVCRTRVALV